MKNILFALMLTASLSAYSQAKPEKPIPLTRLEVDSAKSILQTSSQLVSQMSCLSQGDAAKLQQLFSMMFSMILRKEKEAAPPAEKPKN